MAGNESLKKQREVFTNNHAFLVDYLDADDIIDELIQERMIGKNAAQRVQLQTTNKEKNRIIVEQLTKSGPGTLEKFCEILQNTRKLAFIAEELEKSWEKPCIEKWAQRHDSDLKMISCPQCHCSTSLPNSQLKDLSKNFIALDAVELASARKERTPSNSASNSFDQFEEIFCKAGCSGNVQSLAIFHCTDCNVFMCADCNNSIHFEAPVEKKHDVKSLIRMQRSPQKSNSKMLLRSNSDTSTYSCKVHHKPMEVLCMSDNRIICTSCHFHGDHKGHECVLIDEMAKIKREAMQGLREELNTRHSQCVTGLNLCKRTKEDITRRKVQLKEELDNQFEFLHLALEGRRKNIEVDMIEQLEQNLKLLSMQCSSLSETDDAIKQKMEEIDECCQKPDLLVLQKGDGVLSNAEETLQAEVDSYPLVSDGAIHTFKDQTTLINSILEYGKENIMLTAPGRVTNLKAQVNQEDKVILLTWEKPEYGGIADSYTIEYSADDGQFKPVYTGTDLARQLYLHGTPSKDFVHKCRVMAKNKAGCGPYSPTLSIKIRNPLFHWDPSRKYNSITLTNDNLTAAVGNTTGLVTIGGDRVLSTGRHYWEISLDRFGHHSVFRRIIVGVVSDNAIDWQRSLPLFVALVSPNCFPLCKYWALACGTGKKISHETARRGTAYMPGKQFSESDKVGLLLDLNNHSLEFYKNGEPLGQAFDNVEGPVIPIVCMRFQKAVSLRFPQMPE